MAKNQRAVTHRIFPTAYKILINRMVDPRIKTLTDDVLVIGAGKEHYPDLAPFASTITCVDIEPGEQIDVLADAHALPFKDLSFDSIISVDVLEHLQDPRLAMMEKLRVLKRNGGQVILAAPFMFRVHGDPLDFYRFTRSGLEELFTGFSKVTIYPFGNRTQVISDILTTSLRPAITLRIFNHVLTLGPLARPSDDCPCGYMVEAVK